MQNIPLLNGKMAMFCSAKCKTKTTQKANMNYDIQCPPCIIIVLVKLIDVLLPALMNMEANMINQFSKA